MLGARLRVLGLRLVLASVVLPVWTLVLASLFHRAAASGSGGRSLVVGFSSAWGACAVGPGPWSACGGFVVAGWGSVSWLLRPVYIGSYIYSHDIM